MISFVLYNHGRTPGQNEAGTAGQGAGAPPPAPAQARCAQGRQTAEAAMERELEIERELEMEMKMGTDDESDGPQPGPKDLAAVGPSGEAELEANCEVRGQLLPLDLGPASSSSWTRSVCRPRLASAPPRTQHLNPAHTRAQPTGTARPLLLGRRRALETVDAEVDDAGSTMPSTAPAVAAVVSLATAA